MVQSLTLFLQPLKKKKEPSPHTNERSLFSGFCLFHKIRLDGDLLYRTKAKRPHRFRAPIGHLESSQTIPPPLHLRNAQSSSKGSSMKDWRSRDRERTISRGLSALKHFFQTNQLLKPLKIFFSFFTSIKNLFSARGSNYHYKVQHSFLNQIII